MAQTLSVLGIDIATLVFHAVGMDNAGQVVLRKRLARSVPASRSPPRCRGRDPPLFGSWRPPLPHIPMVKPRSAASTGDAVPLPGSTLKTYNRAAWVEAHPPRAMRQRPGVGAASRKRIRGSIYRRSPPLPKSNALGLRSR
jgi:hypothetical protein